MKPLKINRTNDAVFKNIFANKKHKAITIDFINSVLEFKETAQIKDITFIDRELDGETAGDKGHVWTFLENAWTVLRLI